MCSADTLAELAWSLDHGEMPEWAATVGLSTLVIIDEAGMADTLSLDTAVQFTIDRGASVRLIGDDQQLGPIGAGGVLRDITHTYGTLRLSELHRFTNPTEAAATLALREGKPQALNIYLDHGRVHVGDGDILYRSAALHRSPWRRWQRSESRLGRQADCAAA